MAWAHQDCNETLRLGEQRKDFGRRMKEKLQEEGELRQKAEELAQTRAAKLEVACAELKATQDKLDGLKESSSKFWEDTVMKISQLTARAEDAERKLAKFPKEIDAAKSAASTEYQSLAEFGQVQSEGFEDGVHNFIYNVWHKHPEWDLSFLGPVAREAIAEFNAPPETILEVLPMEFVPPADQSSQAADRPPQVINEDSIAASAGGADEDDEVMGVDNPAGVLSSD